MRLQKLSDGAIRLSQLNPWEVQTFRSLPILADFSDHEAAERRMLPTPAVESDLTPDMGMDWVEYVMPELRDSFARNLTIVMEDLENLKTHFPGDPEADEDGHPAPIHDDNDEEPWGWDDDEDASQSPPSFGTDKKESGPPRQAPGPARSRSGTPQELNYSVDIPADHAELWFRAMNQARLVLSAKHGIDSEHIPDLATLLTSGKLEYWFQYELFVSLQGWLVDAVMDTN